MRLSAIPFFLAIIISSQAIAQQLWLDPNSEFAAKFPTPPEKADASTKDIRAYAYQSTKEYDSGAVFFAITVSNPPTKLTQTNGKSVIEESNRHFIESLGQQYNRAKRKWKTFADGRPRLDYEVAFSYSGVTLHAQGFWIHHRDRIIRVSVTYMTSVTDQQRRRSLQFLDSFVLMTK
ncbi:MAG: hypothetical protein WEF53_01675 [Bacteroidota bacterium]